MLAGELEAAEQAEERRRREAYGRRGRRAGAARLMDHHTAGQILIAQAAKIGPAKDS